MEVQDHPRSPSSFSTGPGLRQTLTMAVLLTRLPSNRSCQSSAHLPMSKGHTLPFVDPAMEQC